MKKKFQDTFHIIWDTNLFSVSPIFCPVMQNTLSLNKIYHYLNHRASSIIQNQTGKKTLRNEDIWVYIRPVVNVYMNY